ncbi:hypothetical protein K503DRAFT_797078 [Rhizopogon vinicolor AM-OR11-026]|uniref:DUF6534 domain-containing protein n=1 Tax=Rhizopogon vinicolor AM-OR11-026 TaxID=1314800 RepID=A0A1B7NCE1_9AGAM|nr:hypothetical protein K503DRAFT_797078 [Rhizopogon vinicolor AM-OR11-026]
MSPFPTGSTYGAYFFSTLLCALLWGVSCIQILSFFTRYVRDDRWLKAIVIVIFMINTVQTALVVHGDIEYSTCSPSRSLRNFFILRGGSSGVLGWISPLMLLYKEYLSSKHTDLARQDHGCFPRSGSGSIYLYTRAFRLKRLSTQVPLGLFELGAAIYCVVMSETLIIFFSPSLKGVVVSYLVITAFVDITIALSLTKSLRKLNRHIVTVATSEMIRRLIIFSIFGGIWTALFALLVMITYLAFPSTAIYLVFYLPLCSLYCNTLLANLNSRDRGSIASLKELTTFRAATGPIVLSTIIGLQDSEFEEERDSIGDDWK